MLNDMSGDIFLANAKRLALDCPMPKRVRPVIIPPTTPRCYLSFHTALNLRLPNELTGDWHFLSAFYSPANGPPVEVRLAGEGMEIDTNPSLGSRGIRDMADILVKKKFLTKNSSPVWVANHARAIADWAMLALQSKFQPYAVTVDDVNQWLDTEAQVDDLISNYLIPLRRQKAGNELLKWDSWLETIRYS